MIIGFLIALVFLIQKIVCIEYNPTIPNMVDFINPRDFKIKQGSGAKSIVSLAGTKGYSLVAVTLTNLIFISDKYADYFAQDIKTLDELNPEGNNPNIIFSGYDGTLFSTHNKISLGWHISFDNHQFQPLPKFLRQYSGDYKWLKRILFKLFIVINYPSMIKKYILRKFSK